MNLQINKQRYAALTCDGGAANLIGVHLLSIDLRIDRVKRPVYLQSLAHWISISFSPASREAYFPAEAEPIEMCVCGGRA